jgi:signal transduction histidine kinase
LNGTAGVFKLPSRDSFVLDASRNAQASEPVNMDEKEADTKALLQMKGSRDREYRIASLQKDSQKEQIITQKRQVVAENVMRAGGTGGQQMDSAVSTDSLERQKAEQRGGSVQKEAKDLSGDSRLNINQRVLQEQQSREQTAQIDASSLKHVEPKQVDSSMLKPSLPQKEAEQLHAAAQMEEPTKPSDTVQIRIEPFAPMVVGGVSAKESIFGGQVFMLRHVQIENRHFLQGFQLNEKKLLSEINDSARRFMREGMDFELSQIQNPSAAFRAILDFGFGDLILNLMEIDPSWIGRQISRLQYWYFSIIGVVFLAVSLGLVSLWRNARAQVKLAEKKDDFISAVSHELRTPLTSIRMYSEMLEKNWVKSEEKVVEYYRNMRQESERLSRLIENVLDFSRIQKKRKKYTFNLGDVNKCIADVVEMMKPYAAQHGFSIKMDLEEVDQTAFDSDAVTQIVVNLLDNAVKYARDATDKTIIVRTRKDNGYTLIEVEDHGPGIPYRQQKKVFEEFYRIGSETTRETTGTGLGLALVKKFAEAHDGFVEILDVRPTGSIFRVALGVQN